VCQDCCAKNKLKSPPPRGCPNPEDEEELDEEDTLIAERPVRLPVLQAGLQLPPLPEIRGAGAPPPQRQSPLPSPPPPPLTLGQVSSRVMKAFAGYAATVQPWPLIVVALLLANVLLLLCKKRRARSSTLLDVCLGPRRRPHRHRRVRMEEFSDEERSDLVESQPSRASARSYPGPAVPALPADYALGARHTSVVHAAAAALCNEDGVKYSL
jgi:hypothetical protein